MNLLNWWNSPINSKPQTQTIRLQPEHPWDLNSPLCHFSDSDNWTVGDSCEGTIVFGATGGGKTSGPGQTLAKAMMRKGYGGLVLCAKADEPPTWIKWAKACGRSNDLQFFTEHSLNFLNYEMQRPGKGAGLTENIVQLLMTAAEISGGSAGGDNDYWMKATKQLIRNTVDLCKLARNQATLDLINTCIQSAPRNKTEAADPRWQQTSLCAQMLKEATARLVNSPIAEQEKDLNIVSVYFLMEFAQMDEKPRSSIVSMFTSIADSFLRGPLRTRFSENTTWVPEFLLAGKIMVVDLPVKEYGELGRYAGVLVKFLVQKALERRKDISDTARPVFIWGDEYQNFAIQYDQQFQSTCRSVRGVTVALTQNYPNLKVEMAKSTGGEAIVDSLLGNLQTKIFCQNGEKFTNTWAAESIGRIKVQKQSTSTSSQGEMKPKSESVSHSEAEEFACPPNEFTTLRKGKLENDCKVDGIIWQGGRQWSNGLSWLKTAFDQRLK